MKKILATSAVAIMLPITVMANPTLYGKIHMSVAHVDNDASYKSVSVASHASRMGIKGTEVLGSGLTFGYQMELTVGMDGSSDVVKRNRGITFGGEFGTFIIGRWDTPMKKLGRKFDMFGDQMGDSRSLPRSGSLMDNRLNNVIAYVSPNMGGLDVFLAYVTDVVDAAPDNTKNDAFSGTAIYSNGPLALGVGYTTVNAFAKTEKDWRVSGSYKIGSIKLVGSYTDVSNGKGTNNYGVAQIGAAMKFGSNTFKIQYIDKGTDVADDGAQLFSVGLDHKMSKRTKLYLEYAQLNNDSASDWALAAKSGNGISAPAGGAGTNPNGFALGIVHKF